MGEYPDQLIVLDQHVSDGLANSFSTGRATFYGVEYIPHVFIDGKYNHVGAASCVGAAGTYRTIIQTRLDETEGVSPVEITGVHWFDGDQLHVEATFELVDPVSLGSVRGYVAVGENRVAASGGPYDHVTRGGFQQTMILIDAGDSDAIATQFTVPGTWDQDELFCVAWIQRPSGDKEVFQSTYLPLGSSADVVGGPVFVQETSLLSVGPNPMPGFVEGASAASVRFALSDRAAAEPIRLDLVDINGRLVREVYHGQVGAGTNMLTWDGRAEDGRPLESGAYWMQMSTTDGIRSTRVVVIN